MHELVHALQDRDVDLRAFYGEHGGSYDARLASPLIASRSAFPYSYGQRFVDFAWQAGGRSAFLDLLAAPPASTHVLMGSSDTPSEPPPQVELSPPVAPGGWSAPGNDVLGAWGLFLALTRAASAEAARPTALAWRGDRFSVYAGPRPFSETALVWQIELADEASASSVAANLGLLVGSAGVQRQETRVVVAAATSAVSLDWAFVSP